MILLGSGGILVESGLMGFWGPEKHYYTGLGIHNY